MTSSSTPPPFSPASPEARAAADAIRRAKGIVITAGAGMGVDSGLPDFRGDEGFWKAYPPYKKLGLAFEDLANPRWFDDDPALAWGFYGHRLNLYRRTKPHDGFHVLKRLSAQKERGAFVFTSNVDGQFQRAGFDGARIAEVHGSIHHFQCTKTSCTGDLWDAPGDVAVDDVTFRAREPFPKCIRCGAIARPNILMFGDWAWDDRRSDAQQEAMAQWLVKAAELVVVEMGAGTAIPTVRHFGEQLTRAGASLIRINVREPQIEAKPPVAGAHVSIAAGAKAALLAIESHLD